MQRGDVAKPNEALVGLAHQRCVESFEQARASVAATRCDNRVRIGVVERFDEFVMPAIVVAGEIASLRENPIVEADLIARFQKLDATVERFFVEGPAWSDQAQNRTRPNLSTCRKRGFHRFCLTRQ